MVQESLAGTELRHNETLEILLDRLDVMKGELQECLEDDSQGVEAAELRGKLAAHLSVETKNQQLQEQLETTHRQLDEVTRSLQVKEQEYLHLGEIVDKQVIELETVAKEAALLKERSSNLSQQRNSMTRKVKEMHVHVEMLNAKVEDYERQIDTFKNRIQLREGFDCKEEYGMGPYYVQISAKVRGNPDSAAWTFVVELASRMDMPHSVFTFLSLVSYEMFEGNTFLAPDREVMTLTAKADFVENLNQKRRVLGMQESILMFHEITTRFPCEDLSVGFQGLGPALEFYLSESESDKSCFGKVVRGGESLKLIRDIANLGTAVDIVQVQHLVL